MANSLTLAELRREGFVPAECDRRMGPFVKDLYGFGDVMGYDPTHLRRPRLVNGCLEDVHAHIRKYLLGDTENTPPKFGPNKHLADLLVWFDLFIYSFVLRKFKMVNGKRSARSVYVCRKWQAIISPQGQVSFELQEEPQCPTPN